MYANEEVTTYIHLREEGKKGRASPDPVSQEIKAQVPSSFFFKFLAFLLCFFLLGSIGSVLRAHTYYNIQGSNQQLICWNHGWLPMKNRKSSCVSSLWGGNKQVASA